MTRWEYRSICMGTPDKNGRRWKVVTHDGSVSGRQVGDAEKPRLVGRFWQVIRLLETAVKELDGEGWELVSHSMSHSLFATTGTALFRRFAKGDSSSG